MPTDAIRRVSRWFFGLAAVTWVLIAFGALVRAKKAGLACPDWPLCFGEVVPDVRLQGVIYEFGHRVLAGLVALAFVGGAVALAKTAAWPKLKTLVFIAGGVLLTQIVFGGLTVLIVHKSSGDPRPETWPVATHLVLGNTFAALGLLIALRLRHLADGEPLPSGEPPPKPATVLRRLWSLSLLAQFVLGGLIAGNIGGLICTEWPSCRGGDWFPSGDYLTVLQVAHRLNAYALLAVGLALAGLSRRSGELGQTARVLGWLVLAQATLGAVNVLSYLHVAVTTAHSLGAALLFSTTMALEWQFGRWKRAGQALATTGA